MNTAADPPDEPKKSGCAKRLFYAFLCGVLMLVGAYVFADWSGRKRWEETRARLEKEGLPMKPRKLERPDVPPEENFGESPLMRAIAGLDGAEGQRRLEPFIALGAVLRDIDSSIITTEGMKEFRSTLGKTGKWSIPSVEGEPEATKAILAALGDLDDQFGDFISHASRSYALRSPAAPQVLLNPSNNFLSSLRLLIYCHLQSGDLQRAVDLLMVNLRFLDLLAAEDSLLSLIFSMGSRRLALRSVESGLDAHHWKDSHLLQLAEVIQKQKFAHYAEVLRNDWLSSHDLCEKPTFSNDFSSHTGWKYLPKGVRLQAKSDHAEFTQTLIRALETGGLPRAIAEAEKISRSPNAESKFAWIYLPYFVVGAYENFLVRSQLDEIITAALRVQLALELHFLQHGIYPKDLSELVPARIESIPADLDGKPLRYLLEAPDRYIIWSIGLNRVDDWGGDWSKMTSDNTKGPRAADWVVTLPSLKLRFEQKNKTPAISPLSAP